MNKQKQTQHHTICAHATNPASFLCLFLFFYSLDLTTLIEGSPNTGVILHNFFKWGDFTEYGPLRGSPYVITV